MSKLVQTCPKLQYDKILSNLMQFDTIDMSRLVIMLWYDLIRFYKHVQTCHNIMIQFDTILQTCLNLSKKMMKYTKIHLKFLRNVLFFSWRQSYTLDRFDERAVKNVWIYLMNTFFETNKQLSLKISPWIRFGLAYVCELKFIKKECIQLEVFDWFRSIKSLFFSNQNF